MSLTPLWWWIAGLEPWELYGAFPAPWEDTAVKDPTGFKAAARESIARLVVVMSHAGSRSAPTRQKVGTTQRDSNHDSPYRPTPCMARSRVIEHTRRDPNPSSRSDACAWSRRLGIRTRIPVKRRGHLCTSGHESWLADVDSNHDSRRQRPLSCRWTICQWSGREDSNLHRPAPEAGGLPITLRPDRRWGDRPDSNRDQEGHDLPCCRYTTATREGGPSHLVAGIVVAGEGIEPP